MSILTRRRLAILELCADGCFTASDALRRLAQWKLSDIGSDMRYLTDAGLLEHAGVRGRAVLRTTTAAGRAALAAREAAK